MEIPGGIPESSFDLRGLARFVQLGNGSELVSILTTRADTTVLTVSLDSITSSSKKVYIRDTVIVLASKNYYRRFRVSLGDTLSIGVDRDIVFPLVGGDQSGYFSIKAGDRHIYLWATGTLTDTIDVSFYDSVHAVRWDTVGGRSAYQRSVSRFDTTTSLLAASPGYKEIILADSTLPTLHFDPDFRVTVYLLHDTTAASVSPDDPRAKHGFMRYVKAHERYTFASNGLTDSTWGARYVNGLMTT